MSLALNHTQTDARYTGLFTWDLKADAVYADEVMALFFGMEPEKAKMGQPIIEYLHRIVPEEKSGLKNAIDDAVLSGDRYSHKYKVLTQDGDHVEVTTIGQCFRDASGTPSVYAGVMYLGWHDDLSAGPAFWHCLRALSLAQANRRLDIVRNIEKALKLLRKKLTGSLDLTLPILA
ncbi:PAS domain-containing protein (plasmid) [Rhizobium bangladeshense]|uniref:PAS domain-containing protein n=1 Tax=Rhizobium bangladeshense TaxID=1138189 RepID=UPI001A99B190|nr:PAS domain-containing protein [Rhizobium bangladeshense]QSY97863.1 PAS domain-containing protein [Rhizobium bangladeshense]